MNVSTDIDSDTELDGDDELFESDTDFDPELEANDVDESFELDSEENDIWFEGGSVSLEATDVEEDPFADEGMEDDDLGLGAEIDLTEGADYQVIAPDTRRRILNTRRRPFRYICKIDPPGCTGTLIAPNKVMTAAHCVYDRARRSRYANIRVIPGKNGPGTSRRAEPFGSARAVRVNFPAAYASAPNYMSAWPHDYAVITLDRAIGRRVGTWARMASVPASRLTRLRLNTAGYPGDKGGQHLYWTYNRVVSVRGSRIEYLLDTFGGQSGSPVWLRSGNRRTLVAIHTARDDAGVAGATPVVANRGVALTPDVIRQIRAWTRS